MHFLQGSIQHYAWGTMEAIPELLRQQPDGTPHAEYWLGTHAQGPALAGETSLRELIAENPGQLGERVRQAFGDELPFLMKVLSARHALSIQAHPSREQAEHGYARENAAGIPLDAPERVYSDPWPKPEILIALDLFETLSGFREPLETAALLSGLGVTAELGSLISPLTERRGAAALAQVFLEVLSLEGERARLTDVVSAAALRHAGDPDVVGDFARTIVELDTVFPGDPGILAALLMNRVTLRPGEAMYVPAGQMHAHLRGTGVEVMANSDNVIRGGLTAKHVDVSELVTVVDFEPREPRILAPIPLRPGLEGYDVRCPEFEVWRVLGTDQPTALPGEESARILFLTDGSLTVHEPDGDRRLERGEAVFLAAGELGVTTSGDGLAFLTASGTR
ncbi:MAG: mannose-6-phosphate isomerase, class I [Propionicimonas sp.]